MSRQAGFTSSWRSAQQGFTLVEMMISLLIFALLAAAGVSLLSFGVRAQAVANRKLDDVAALGRLDGVLAADLAQALPRRTRDAGGGAQAPFAMAQRGVLLRLARGGWANVDAAPRASVQKVEYVLDDEGVLSRVGYPMVDGAEPLPAAAMLSDVASVRLRSRFGGAWSDSWKGSPDAPLPDAVELTIARSDGTVFRELFQVGTGHAMTSGGTAGAR